MGFQLIEQSVLLLILFRVKDCIIYRIPTFSFEIKLDNNLALSPEGHKIKNFE